jgi:hypothetical protein
LELLFASDNFTDVIMSDSPLNPPEPSNEPLTPKAETVGTVPALVVRLWPKIPVLYPAAFIAFICGIIAYFTQGDPKMQQVLGLVFLASLTLCLFTLTFDIGLTWALLWLFGLVIIGLVLFIINIFHPFLPEFFSWLNHLNPQANYQFYFCIFALWAALMIVGFIYVSFHYVRFESNEIIVVGGVMDKRRRYSTQGLTYTKEVTDVFEHYLPFIRSGRLILRFPNEEEPLVLENVMGIDGVIRRLELLTSVMVISTSSKPS